MGMQGTVENNREVVVYVVAILGGAQQPVHTEEIAAKAHELAPARFSWSLHRFSQRGWPDKEVARSALEDAQKEEYGALVAGAHNREPSKDGWRLTERGVQWLRENSSRIERVLRSAQPTLREVERKRFVRRIRKQPLFDRFAQTGSLEGSTQSQFAELLNCSTDAPTDIVASKFDRMRTIAALAADDEISLFLDVCAERFRAALGEVGCGGQLEEET